MGTGYDDNGIVSRVRVLRPQHFILFELIYSTSSIHVRFSVKRSMIAEVVLCIIKCAIGIGSYYTNIGRS